MTDAQIRYYYDNAGEVSIFEPVYEFQNAVIYSAMIQSLSFNQAFVSLENTAWVEKYLVNALQFSSAKNLTTAEYMKSQVFDENNRLRPYSEFFKIVKSKVDIINTTWLRVERDLAARAASSADTWMKFEKDKDIFPYWTYISALKETTRPWHAKMHGKIFKIGDPVGDKLFFPNGWNCLCTARQSNPTDKSKVQTTEQARELTKGIDDGFAHNAAQDGVFSMKASSYSQVLSSANKANSSMYKGGKNTNLASNDNDNESLLRNKNLKLNVQIGKFNKDYDEIKNIVSKSENVYGSWINEKKQDGTRLVYEHKGMIVTTENGIVVSVEKLKNKVIQGVKLVL